MISKKPENTFIPQKAAELPAGPWFVVAPHPDDETLGMGGTLALGAQKKIATTIVFVTEGEKFADPQMRRNEARNACGRLGLSEKNLVFWNFKDQYLPGKCDDLQHRLLTTFSELTPAPKTIFTPSMFDFHPDHRAVTWNVLQAFGHLEIDMWFYEVYHLSEVNRLVDISSILSFKKAAADAYRSQEDILPYKDSILGLNRFRALSISREKATYAEAFWAANTQEVISVKLMERLACYFSGAPDLLIDEKHSRLLQLKRNLFLQKEVEKGVKELHSIKASRRSDKKQIAELKRFNRQLQHDIDTLTENIVNQEKKISFFQQQYAVLEFARPSSRRPEQRPGRPI